MFPQRIHYKAFATCKSQGLKTAAFLYDANTGCKTVASEFDLPNHHTLYDLQLLDFSNTVCPKNHLRFQVSFLDWLIVDRTIPISDV